MVVVQLLSYDDGKRVREAPGGAFFAGFSHTYNTPNGVSRTGY